MARTILLLGAAGWLLAGAAGLVLALTGTEALLSVLPPLAIDADALGGALTAIGLTITVMGAAHLVVAFGVRAGRRWAMSAGVLLTSTLAVASVGLAAAAISSALRQAAMAAPLLVGGAVGFLAAAAYGIAAVRLARRLGSGSPV